MRLVQSKVNYTQARRGMASSVDTVLHNIGSFTAFGHQLMLCKVSQFPACISECDIRHALHGPAAKHLLHGSAGGPIQAYKPEEVRSQH